MQIFTIGRDATNQIVVNDNFVSRNHAQLIVYDDGQVLLKDLGSANGTFVNGNKITESYLKSGDIVKCGGGFLNWAQYAKPNQAAAINANKDYQQESGYQDTAPLYIENTIDPQFSFGETWKYLTIKIFNAGDLFKTEWNKTIAILFFLLTPLIITFALLLYIASKMHSGLDYFMQSPLIGMDEVLLAMVTIVIIFGISQFLTIGLLSINRKTSLNKTLLASSIFSFLQFIPCLLMIIGYSSNLISKHGIFNDLDSLPGYFFLVFLVITILISSLVTLILFINKYFRAIGISKGVSLHFTIISFTLNLFIQSILLYVFFLIVKEYY